MKKHQPVLEQMFKVLNNFKPQVESYYDHLSEILRPIYFPKDQIAYEQGDIVKQGYFMASGFAFSYCYNHQGERQVIRIYTRNDFIKGKSFIEQSPSLEYLMLCAGSYVLSITYDQMDEIYRLFPMVQELSRLVLASREARELEYKKMLGMEAAMMVAAFYRNFPELEQPGKIIVDSDIASYLLISERTLRACRAKLKLT